MRLNPWRRCPVFEVRYDEAVLIGDKNYVLDDDGNRVLIGLTVDETREFFELTDLLAWINEGKTLTSIDWAAPEEMRWLELIQKHFAALDELLRNRTTKH